MKKQMKNEQGFTLIELVMVIAILGILAAAAIPIFRDLADDANAAAREGMVGAIRGGINTVYAQAVADPAIADTFVATLDGQANGPCAAGCFTNVLAYPVTDGTWSKNNNVYTHVATGVALTYNSGQGTFN